MPEDEAESERCGAETQSGEPCKNPADACPHHGPDADEKDSGGRPSKLTEERVNELCEHLRNGMSITASCRAVGISETTYHEWRQLGEADEAGNSAYSYFSERVARARSEGERELTQTMVEIAEEQGDARTLFSFLKAQYPDSFETDTEGDKKQSSAGWFERLEAATEADEADYEELI